MVLARSSNDLISLISLFLILVSTAFINWNEKFNSNEKRLNNVISLHVLKELRVFWGYDETDCNKNLQKAVIKKVKVEK